MSSLSKQANVLYTYTQPTPPHLCSCPTSGISLDVQPMSTLSSSPTRGTYGMMFDNQTSTWNAVCCSDSYARSRRSGPSKMRWLFEVVQSSGKHPQRNHRGEQLATNTSQHSLQSTESLFLFNSDPVFVVSQPRGRGLGLSPLQGRPSTMKSVGPELMVKATTPELQRLTKASLTR